MKKKLRLLTFAVIGIITAIAITQIKNTYNAGLLHENVEALAWDQSGGGDNILCTQGGAACRYYMIVYDSEGNPKTDSEGNIILQEREIAGLKNLPSEAQ